MEFENMLASAVHSMASGTVYLVESGPAHYRNLGKTVNLATVRRHESTKGQAKDAAKPTIEVSVQSFFLF